MATARIVEAIDILEDRAFSFRIADLRYRARHKRYPNKQVVINWIDLGCEMGEDD